MMDWTDPSCLVSKYFTVKEAIWLPKWQRLASVGDGLTPEVEQTLEDFFIRFMDPVREFLGKPMRVHCCFRPEVYNREVGGAKDSAHMAKNGYAALDFDTGEQCANFTRSQLLPRLADFGLRMEDLPDSNWTHLDNAPVKTNRYFKP